jgi:hypothetical protein
VYWKLGHILLVDPEEVEPQADLEQIMLETASLTLAGLAAEGIYVLVLVPLPAAAAVVQHGMVV